MKKYLTPEFEKEEIDTVDVICASVNPPVLEEPTNPDETPIIPLSVGSSSNSGFGETFGNL